MGDKLCNTHWSALSRQVRQLAVFGLTAQAVLLKVNSGGKKKRKEARDWVGRFFASGSDSSASQVMPADGKAK